MKDIKSDALVKISAAREDTELLVKECTDVLVDGVLSDNPNVVIASILKALKIELAAEEHMEEMIRANPGIVHGFDSDERVEVFNELVEAVSKLYDSMEKIIDLTKGENNVGNN